MFDIFKHLQHIKSNKNYLIEDIDLLMCFLSVDLLIINFNCAVVCILNLFEYNCLIFITGMPTKPDK